MRIESCLWTVELLPMKNEKTILRRFTLWKFLFERIFCCVIYTRSELHLLTIRLKALAYNQDSFEMDYSSRMSRPKTFDCKQKATIQTESLKSGYTTNIYLYSWTNIHIIVPFILRVIDRIYCCNFALK